MIDDSALECWLYFEIVILPFLDGDVPRAPAYGVLYQNKTNLQQEGPNFTYLVRRCGTPKLL